MAVTEEQQPIREAVQAAATDGRIHCKQLFDLSEKTGTSLAQLGQLCNELNLHISECQLGCFH